MSVWIYKDPESGFHVESNLHRYEDTGKTLPEEFPELYFQCPIWAAWLLRFTGWLHRWAMAICGLLGDKWKAE